ncbi:hypothetical protein PPSIR1_11265 [Plesiocystis pacifica SIR-1]|uniref:VWFA domain-containing protein n=1 Tax=Plesiocystis pacifica SIR-1 TaxID=391625 RepID=A6G156_9BACT|nr:VWA domain-containing protein [Plesiocystis pacifica]EDM80351.1 hypothetical protein PPSIR1_11265 [Plesiocystis pacifica SIR-1]
MWLQRNAPVLALTALGLSLGLAACDKGGSSYQTHSSPLLEVGSEDYAPRRENPYFDAARVPLSTVSVDVDTAAYSNVRRFLRDGHLPPSDAVRIEELINYFDYDYPQPAADAEGVAEPFSVTTEVGPCPWSDEARLVHIGLQGKSIPERELPPRNLVFLLDVSGSMHDQDKLPLLTDSLRVLVNQLGERDHVAIVVYAGASGVVLPPTRGSDRGTILAAISELRAGGSTNGGEGIQKAYALAREHFDPQGINRVILATDGDFNVGTTTESGLENLIERERESGVFLTVLGFGRGNLGDRTMEMLADKGNGNYAYIDSLAEARKVLGTEAGSTLVTIAKDVKLQVEFNPAEVQSYRLLGYENRLLSDADFEDDREDAGDIGAGHSVTFLYEVVPHGAGPEPEGEGEGATSLRYQEARQPSAQAGSGELMWLRLRYEAPEGATSRERSLAVHDEGAGLDESSVDFRFAAAVAEYGMLLGGSLFRGKASWTHVRELAEDSVGSDPHGHRAEFVDLVRKATALSRG